MAALDTGFDIKASGVTLDRFCGSGITAVNLAAAQVMSGMENLVIAGGTEMKSHVMDYRAKVRAAGVAAAGGLGTGNARLQEKHPQSNQGVAADAIAAIEGISRAAIAIKEGRFDKSTVAVLDDDGNVVLDHEEFPRPDTSAETLAGMKPAFEMFRDMPSGPRRQDLCRTDLAEVPRRRDQGRAPRRHIVTCSRWRGRGADRHRAR